MPYQMPNGKWRATKMIGGQRRSKLFATKTEAKKWEAQQTETLWMPEEKDQTPLVCLHDFLTAYLQAQQIRVSEHNIYEKTLAFRRALQTLSPDQPVESISVAQADTVMHHIATKHTPYAANQARKNLAAAWEWGRKAYGLPAANPFREAEKLPYDEKPRYVPSEDDFWRVYDACEDERDKVLLLFFLHTGARRGEAFRLVWPDVDFTEQKARLGSHKTAAGVLEYAWVPLTSELAAALRKLKESAKGLTVFVNKKDGSALVHCNKFMRRLCARAGVNPFGFHAIRHLTATILAHSGLDLPSVQTVLRHHNPTTTARYIQSLGVQANRLDDVFQAKKEGGKVSTFTPSKNSR